MAAAAAAAAAVRLGLAVTQSVCGHGDVSLLCCVCVFSPLSGPLMWMFFVVVCSAAAAGTVPGSSSVYSKLAAHVKCVTSCAPV